MEKLPISLGILSFKAPKTIDLTLTQYGDFLSHFDEAKLFFQCFSETDKQIAESHHVLYEGRPDNIGIQGGMRWVAENLKSDYILYLENDFQLSVDIPHALAVLKDALNRIESGQIDIMRLRSRFTPGDPFQDVVKYTRIFKPRQIHPDFSDFKKIQKTNPLLRFINPLKARKLACRSLFIEQYPEKRFPNYIKKDGDVYVIDSAYLNWTNNPFLMKLDLFLRLMDYADAHPSHRTVGGMQDMEKPLNCGWWRRQHFKIGIGDGIFTHRRIDR